MFNNLSAIAASLMFRRDSTYTDGGEDILQLVHKRDQTRVVHIDPGVPRQSLYSPSLHQCSYAMLTR